MTGDQARGAGRRTPAGRGRIARWCGGSALACAAMLVSVLPARGAPADPEQRFRDATSLARSGDAAAAIAVYRELAAAGRESGSLYWNWAQAAEARGAAGEALWALLRGREVEAGDAAAGREIERLRSALNLDPAELSPSPLAPVARAARRLHLGALAALLLLASLAAHAGARFARTLRWPVPAAWVSLVLGTAAATVVVLGSLAPPTAVVLRRDAPLVDAASPTASALGAMREGEVVPVLDASGPYIRVQDSSGARGWAHADDVRRLDRAPAAAR